jgi:hypothetical protein
MPMDDTNAEQQRTLKASGAAPLSPASSKHEVTIIIAGVVTLLITIGLSLIRQDAWYLTSTVPMILIFVLEVTRTMRYRSNSTTLEPKMRDRLDNTSRRPSAPVSPAESPAESADAVKAQQATLRAEAEAVATDPDDVAEARAVLNDMESLRAW